MSGIVGIFFLDGRAVESTTLERMIDSITHRGPDGSGAWFKGPVGLGHRMLWTTPESLHEQLPIVSETGDIILTADARIDNRDELISVLSQNNRPSNEISDGELILNAYEKWGKRCPEMLVGDFAFVVWDGRKRTLFCARDHIGVKPFYYFHSENLFVFASEIKALFLLEAVPRRLNEVGIADHLAGFFEDPTTTIYQEIYRLPPAHSMSVGPEGIRLNSYWSLDSSREIRFRSDDEYAEAFLEVFKEAVRCRLRSAFRVGFALSGGLDSSSITCTARQLLTNGDGQPIHTFSAIFPGLPDAVQSKIDERPYMEAVYSLGGFKPHYVHVDRISPFVDLDRLLWHLDEVCFAPNFSLHWALFKTANQQNIRVFIDGIDGDETVSHGLEYLTDLTRTGRWRTLFNEANAIVRRSGANEKPLKIIWRRGIRPLIPESVVYLWRELRGDSLPVRPACTAIKSEFTQRIRYKERLRERLRKTHPLVTTAREIHKRRLTSASIPLALEWLDKASKAFSMEIRYPFFDRRLLEFCLALPPEQKLFQGWTRIILRRAMEGILPKAVQWRHAKANISLNFLHGFLDHEKETLERVICLDSQVIEPYVDLTILRAAYHRYLRQPASIQDAQTVYSAVILAIWLECVGI